MAEQRAEIAAITALPGPPTFDDTVVALERSGATLRRVSAVFFVLVGSLSTPGVRETEARVAPLLAAHADSITLDPALFARLDALHAARAELGLDPESLRLLERRHRDAVRAGARLDPAAQERLRALNAELSALSTEFGARLLADTNDAAVVVDDPARLDGLSPDAIAAAARAAEIRGHPGRHLLPLVLPTHQPALASLTDRALREQLFRASVSRGTRGTANDTSDVVRRITTLRAERAGLLGHPHHASWVIEVGTAATVEVVEKMLAALVPPAVRNAEAEAAELAAAAGHPIEPWDRAFYTEAGPPRARASDTAALRPYLELERVLHHGVFAAAGELYGLQFTERHDLPVYHPDVRVFHVKHDGEPVGLFVADHYARETKRGGAWMNSFVAQSRLLGTRPVVLNTLNLTKPAAGADAADRRRGRARSSTSSATPCTGCCRTCATRRSPAPACRATSSSSPRRSTRCGCAIRRWSTVTPATTCTGEPLPDDLRARLIDQAPHVRRGVRDHRVPRGGAARPGLAPARAGRARWTTSRRSRRRRWPRPASRRPCPRATAARTSTTCSPAAYSAAYYSYIWSEVLDADTVDWFAEHGGLRRENGDAFAGALLSRGGAVDPWRRTAPSAAATRRSARCWPAGASGLSCATTGETTPPRPVGSSGRGGWESGSLYW